MFLKGVIDLRYVVIIAYKNSPLSYKVSNNNRYFHANDPLHVSWDISIIIPNIKNAVTLNTEIFNKSVKDCPIIVTFHAQLYEITTCFGRLKY